VINRVSDIYLPGRTKDKRSVRAAQDVVETRKAAWGGMSKAEADAFTVAFIIYIVSTLLILGSKHDYVSFDYWNALADPTSIKLFDWCML